VNILSVVLPVFALVLVGFLYARRHAPDMGAANRVNLDVFIPALIFHAMSGEDFRLLDYGGLALGGALVVLLSGLIAWVVARVMGMDWRTLVPPMMFVNSGNMGLPLALLAFGESMLPAAVVLFLLENLLHFTVGLRMLDRRASLLGLLRIPMIQATLAGLAVALLDLKVPAPLAVAVEMLGQVAIPLMLFALGVRLKDASLEHWRVGVLGALLRPLSGLAVAVAVLPWLDLAEGQVELLLLFAALPPAVLNYIIAERYDQEPGLVAAIVIWGNLASAAVIPVILAWTAP
jgi:predicted permease